jgi:hypothetical protein
MIIGDVGGMDVSLWAPSMLGGSGGSAIVVAVGAICLSTLLLLSKLPDMIPQFIFMIKPSPWGQAIGQGMGDVNKFAGGIGTFGLQQASQFEKERYASNEQNGTLTTKDNIIHASLDAIGTMGKIKR